MRFVLIFIGILFALDLLWWVVSARFARVKFARTGVAIFALAQLTGLIWLLTQRFSHAESRVLFSKFVMATIFIWHMIVLPLLLLIAVVLLPIVAIAIATMVSGPAPALISARAL